VRFAVTIAVDISGIVLRDRHDRDSSNITVERTAAYRARSRTRGQAVVCMISEKTALAEFCVTMYTLSPTPSIVDRIALASAQWCECRLSVQTHQGAPLDAALRAVVRLLISCAVDGVGVV
jgi:hypothetical protein